MKKAKQEPVGNCPTCKSRLRQCISVLVETWADIPILNKNSLRSKDVSVIGEGGGRPFFLCSNPKCGWWKYFINHKH